MRANSPIRSSIDPPTEADPRIVSMLRIAVQLHPQQGTMKDLCRAALRARAASSDLDDDEVGVTYREARLEDGGRLVAMLVTHRRWVNMSIKQFADGRPEVWRINNR